MPDSGCSGKTAYDLAQARRREDQINVEPYRAQVV